MVWFHPVWWGGLPALTKGFIDRVFTPGFAFKYRENSVWWDKLLSGKTALFFRINRKAFVFIDRIQKVGQFFNRRLKVTTSHLSGDDAVVSRERVGNFKEWLNR